METLKEFFTPKRIIAYGLMILAFVAVALFAPHEQVGIGESQELIELNDTCHTRADVRILYSDARLP